MTRCSYRIGGAVQCGTSAPRSFFVNGQPGEWRCCGPHGRRMLRELMAAFPGHGVYTRRSER